MNDKGVNMDRECHSRIPGGKCMNIAEIDI